MNQYYTTGWVRQGKLTLTLPKEFEQKRVEVIVREEQETETLTREQTLHLLLHWPGIQHGPSLSDEFTRREEIY